MITFIVSVCAVYVCKPIIAVLIILATDARRKHQQNKPTDVTLFR